MLKLSVVEDLSGRTVWYGWIMATNSSQ